MNTQYIKNLLQRPLFLGIVIIAAFMSGGVIALLGFGLLIAGNVQPKVTATPSGCQIELSVTHELYDTREDYWQNALPIGELESGTYGVIGTSDELIAIDWRGDIDVHPVSLELTDWIFPIDGINHMNGDCTNVTRFAPIFPSLTAVP